MNHLLPGRPILCQRVEIMHTRPTPVLDIVTTTHSLAGLPLPLTGLVRLDSRREEITQCTFRQVKCSTHPVHYLLPKGFHFSDDIKANLPFFSSKV